MDSSTDREAGTVHSTLHIIPDLVTEITTIPATVTHTTDRNTTETTIGARDTNRTIGTNRRAKINKTGMITIKTGIGSTTEGDQTNTNTIETHLKHKSSSSTQIKTYQKC